MGLDEVIHHMVDFINGESGGGIRLKQGGNDVLGTPQSFQPVCLLFDVCFFAVGVAVNIGEYLDRFLQPL